MLPELKKRITSFLVGENGKISKQSLLSIGSFLGTGLLASVLVAKNANASATHVNAITVKYSGGLATGTHNHHSSHESSVFSSACGACATAPCSSSPCTGGGPCCGACACS